MRAYYSISAPLSVTVNGAGADGADFGRALDEHAERIVQQIMRVLSIEAEREAVV
jgi:hypothetical protein